MSEQHTKSLTVPVSTLIAVIVLWLVSFYWADDHKGLVVCSTVAMWVTVGGMAGVIAGRLDERWHKEAQEHSRQWFGRYNAR